MAIVWDEKFSTGDATIDAQHKNLFTCLDQLQQAMKQGRGKEVISDLLDFLDRYVRGHFSFEEKCMTERKCPFATANKNAHQAFIMRFSELRAQMDAGKNNAALVLQIHKELTNWLVHHICGIDTNLKKCAAPA